MERLVDEKWVPVEELAAEETAWSDVDKMFQEIDQGIDASTERKGGSGDAAGAVDQGAGAGGDLAVPAGSAGGGPLALVEDPAQAGSNGSGVTEKETDEFIDEIPGLTVSDGKTGLRGGRGVLRRLREGAKKRHTGPQKADLPVGSTESPRPGEEAVRLPKRVEVAESAAHARGPAVRDTTEHRQLARGRGTVGGGDKDAAQGSRIVSKPAPGILGDQPRWVRELFEAHFRSSRTGELRRKPSGPEREVDGVIVTPNRMKMSREDFAIGWLVMLEAARRDPEILRAAPRKNGAVTA